MRLIPRIPYSPSARVLIALVLAAVAPTADVAGEGSACSAAYVPPHPARPADSVHPAYPTQTLHTTEQNGRMLVLPGVYNTLFQLRGFIGRAQDVLPGFEIETQRWGTPLLPLHNLRDYEGNLATAERIASEIAGWRRAHPNDVFYLVGYSGGGGMAALVASALPDDVVIDRLILIAPAISPDYPLAEKVLPHIRELVVNFASVEDLQVGWGTRTFGTIDRKRVDSAGAVGFALDDPKLVEWHWRPADEGCHGGNHIAYLDRAWQRTDLLPALAPAITADALAARWDARHEEEL